MKLLAIALALTLATTMPLFSKSEEYYQDEFRQLVLQPCRIFYFDAKMTEKEWQRVESDMLFIWEWKRVRQPVSFLHDRNRRYYYTKLVENCYSHVPKE